MYKIIIGMFFIAFNFPIKIEYVIIGLIPDFVGYLLIRRGLGELPDEENHFQEAYKGTTAAIAYSAVIYGLDLFGITGLIVYDGLVGALTGILVVMREFLCLSILMYITNLITSGICKNEERCGRNKNGRRLGGAWKSMAFVWAASFIASFLSTYLPYVSETIFVVTLLSWVMYELQVVICVRR